VALSSLLLVAGCAGLLRNAAVDSGMDFAIIGDMPYDARQEKEVANLMKELNTANLAFVIHNGDFWWDGLVWKADTKGLPPCADETFADRLTIVNGSKHPFILMPGDNDWADCHRAKPVAYDPMERLAKLRQMFFSGDESLGQRKMRLTRQSDDPKYAKYRENVRWTHGDVMFVTLHMIGSNNNLGRTPEMDAEYAERNAANLVWMHQSFELAARQGSKAIMIVAQANPRFETSWPAKVQERYMLAGLGIKPPEKRRATGFDEFIAAVEKETLAFGKPVVYVHGDTHLFRIDKPLVGTSSKRAIENFTRVETVGYPDTHWVRVRIDPDDPNVFVFRQQIVNDNRAQH
jgi:hypothetical protein